MTKSREEKYPKVPAPSLGNFFPGPTDWHGGTGLTEERAHSEEEHTRTHARLIKDFLRDTVHARTISCIRNVEQLDDTCFLAS